METKGIIATAVLAAGIVVAGFAVKDGLKTIKGQRSVAVKGLSEREVLADHVTWPIAYNVTGNDLSSMYEEIERNNKLITAYLIKNGISHDEISQGQSTLQDHGEWQSAGSQYTFRYIITSVLTVSTSKVELVRKLQNNNSELMKQGIAIKANGNWEASTTSVKYTYTKLNEIKPQMLEESTKNARVAAEVFAKQSDSEIGEIVSASQGQFSIENRDAFNPQIKKIRVVTSVEFELED